MRNYFVSNIFIVVLLAIASIAQGQNANKALVDEIAYVAQNLDKATFNPVREGWQFDYGFKDGGLLNSYEYLRSLSSFATLQRIVPEPVFNSGPHSGSALNLTDNHSFGHYNPYFVSLFHDAVKQLIGDQNFISLTSGAMAQYGLTRKLRNLQEIYRYAEGNPAEFSEYRDQFEQKLEQQNWPKGGYRTFMPDKLNKDYYWNWSETAYYFWIRRDIDGTKSLWIRVIDDLLQAYQPTE